MKKTIILAVFVLFVTTSASVACSRDPKVLDWLKKNGDIEEGKIRITKYPGAYETIASVQWSIKHEGVVYISYFKGGIVAYNEELEEHYILFAPDSLYNWSMVGKKAGKYLLIATTGEGLAVINLATLEMKRYRLGKPDDYIRTLKVEGNKVIVNGARNIELLKKEDGQARESNDK